MAIFNMMPPSNGALNSVSFDGRTYSSAPGVPIPVPDFDAAVLQANGWTTVPPQPFLDSGLAIQVSQASGSIGSLAGVYVPPLNSSASITTLYGLYFANNPGSGIGTKHCILCQDAGADINTIGPIVTTGLTTTGTFQLDTGTKTATAVAGAATLNKASGKITTESLTTAAGASYTLTLTNSAIAATGTVYVSVANGTNSGGLPVVGLVTPAAGSVTIIVNNMHASAAFNGTLKISFASMKA